MQSSLFTNGTTRNTIETLQQALQGEIKQASSLLQEQKSAVARAMEKLDEVPENEAVTLQMSIWRIGGRLPLRLLSKTKNAYEVTPFDAFFAVS